MSLPYMPLFWGDYLRDTQHLTITRSGIYLHLINTYWCRGGPLPDDDEQLAAVCKLSVEEWLGHRPVIAAFFEVRDGLWHHKRIDAELAKAKAKYERRKAAADRRWEKERERKAHADADAMHDAMHVQPEPYPYPDKKEERERERGYGGEEPSPAAPATQQGELLLPIAGGAEPKRPRKLPGRPLPADWHPSPELKAKAAALRRNHGKPDIDLNAEAVAFRLHWAASGGLMRDWDQAFLKWSFKAEPAPARKPRLDPLKIGARDFG